MPLNATSKEDVPSTFDFCYEESELYPYFMDNSLAVSETNPGVIIELIRNTFAKHSSVEFTMRRAPWNRCLAQLKEGKVDGVFGAYSKERDDFASYPTTGGEVDLSYALPGLAYCLFTLNSSPLAWQDSRLIGYEEQTLVVPRSYSITAMLDELDIPYEETYSGYLALELLVAKRASGSINLCVRGETLLKFLNNDNSIYRADLIRNQPGFLIINQQFFSRYKDFSMQLWNDLAEQRDLHTETLMNKYKDILPSHLE